MVGCTELKLTFVPLCGKTRQQRLEEAKCAVCRTQFCCAKDRERHEDAAHDENQLKAARLQRQMLKEKKPLVCSTCCQVFLSGLFVNNRCSNASSRKHHFQCTVTTHDLVVFPEWAVEKYLIANQRKRSWDISNDVVQVDIMVYPAENIQPEEGSVDQENSCARRTNIQGILTKQRKTELSAKHSRRVTFSPVTAVAFTAGRQSIIRVPTGTDEAPTKQSIPISVSNPDKEMRPSSSSVPTHLSIWVPHVASDYEEALTETQRQFQNVGLRSADVVEIGGNGENGKRETFVFSPPLPESGNNGSPMMEPQMASTPMSQVIQRTTGTLGHPSTEQQKCPSEVTAAGEGIFSSLANIICCAFQALPAVMSQFFSLNNENQPENTEEPIPRRQRRRRSASFTPYATNSFRRRSRDNAQDREQHRYQSLNASNVHPNNLTDLKTPKILFSFEH